MPGSNLSKVRFNRQLKVGFSRRLLNDDSGATAVIFAIAFSFIFLVVAMAIDYGRASNEKMRQQVAIDAATLAASEKLGLEDQDVAGKRVAQAFYDANTRPESRGTLDDLVLDAQTGSVRAKGNGWSVTSLLNGVKISKINLATGSRVVRGTNNVEIALVLDNSGSMAGQYIADLRTAANNLLDVVFAGAAGTERVRVGVIPFAASVNVGSQNANATWMDINGLSSIHNQNVASPRKRFDLFADMGVAWGGCVEVRPAPHDVTDSLPVAAVPDSLFVPMLAPDEPDAENRAGKTYNNSYLVDDGGACTPQSTTCTATSKRTGKCTSWAKDPLDPAVAQARLCKYVGQTPSGGSGPNYNCTTQRVLPLTSTKADIQSTVDSMIASGMTNIGEGVMWGLRVLSPEEPFTEGRAWSDTDNAKYMVVMTDGENTYTTYDNQNKSMYGAYGYAAKNRLGTTYTQTAIKSEMNAKLIAACSAAKSKGITIYTIAFRLETDPTTQALLTACATTTDRAYRASDGTSLISAFEQIGREITTLRVAG